MRELVTLDDAHGMHGPMLVVDDAVDPGGGRALAGSITDA
jgi:hypothetical protein